MGQQKNHGLFDFEISKENCGKKNKETIYEVQISQVKDSFIFQFQPVSNKGKLVDSNLPTAYRLTHPDRWRLTDLTGMLLGVVSHEPPEKGKD